MISPVSESAFKVGDLAMLSAGAVPVSHMITKEAKKDMLRPVRLEEVALVGTFFYGRDLITGERTSIFADELLSMVEYENFR